MGVNYLSSLCPWFHHFLNGKNSINSYACYGVTEINIKHLKKQCLAFSEILRRIRSFYNKYMKAFAGCVTVLGDTQWCEDCLMQCRVIKSSCLRYPSNAQLV